MHKMHIAQATKPITFYSLNIILAVGYRTNSFKAIAFRRWANSVLKQHLIDGFTIHRMRVQKNYNKFLNAAQELKVLLTEGHEARAKDVLRQRDTSLPYFPAPQDTATTS